MGDIMSGEQGLGSGRALLINIRHISKVKPSLSDGGKFKVGLSSHMSGLGRTAHKNLSQIENVLGLEKLVASTNSDHEKGAG